jgi:hypothetical protein
VAVLLVGVAIAIVWARSTITQLGDTTPTTVERTIAVAPGASADASAPSPPAAARPQDAPGDPGASFSDGPLTLDIGLQEGNFTIEPGPPGRQVQVKGTFAPGLYELVETHDAASRRSTIRFRSKAPMWARILSGLVDGNDNDRDRPELTVVIPSEMPMNLNLAVSMGESRIDLGGLTLGDVDLDVSMGQHRIDFGTPLGDAVRRLRVDASMGEVAIENLGNARPQSVETSASMGSLTADLGGAWQAGSDAALSFTSSMGELTLRVPSAVRLDADIRDAEGRAQRPPSGSGTEDPNAPLLKVRVENSMGETRVVRY